MELARILDAGLRLRASDIHLAAGAPPLVRVDGVLNELPEFPVLSAESCRALVYSALYDEQRARFERDLELDCALSVPGLTRVRLNVLMQRQSVEAILRIVPTAIPSAEALGLGPTAMSLADFPRGLVLVTGAAGCGKSTTLACLIHHINSRQRRHIVTIEDPIEFVHTRIRSLVRQREVGVDTRSFGQALRHALRQDPDVLLVGELRDLETMA
ncbi:MAG: Flp pilus assembly complex ATPase component TadA, partial [Elusimicrobia bacterium]|nr:Flp pilus assembly complex ATPase component TadA [Elusimicrobiota bacterium]